MCISKTAEVLLVVFYLFFFFLSGFKCFKEELLVVRLAPLKTRPSTLTARITATQQ